MSRRWALVFATFLFARAGTLRADTLRAANCEARLRKASAEMAKVVPAFANAQLLVRPDYFVIESDNQTQRFAAKILPLESVRRIDPPGPWSEISGYEDFSGFDERQSRMFVRYKGLVGAREKNPSLRETFFKIFKAAIEDCVAATSRGA